MIGKIFGWASGLDIQGKIIMAFAALAPVGICIATAFHVVDALTETATETGAMKERVETQGKVIENVRQANDAREEVRRNGGPDRASCLRDSRTPENC